MDLNARERTLIFNGLDDAHPNAPAGLKVNLPLGTRKPSEIIGYALREANGTWKLNKH
jgi:hypothetical protein